jgi:PPOX class probable F420-dependent enzyme
MVFIAAFSSWPVCLADRLGHLASAQRAGVKFYREWPFASIIWPVPPPADRDAAPHVVPVCFAICNDTLYVTIDAKPKRSLSTPLKRLKNIAQNPAVAVVVDRYEEDWGQLGWVMLRGHAEILIDGREHDQAQALLRSRYPQLKRMQIAELPVIAVRIASATSWGNLSLAKSD